MNGGHLPHPVPLPMGEGTLQNSRCGQFRGSFSHGEKDRMRGVTFDYGRTVCPVSLMLALLPAEQKLEHGVGGQCGRKAGATGRCR